VPLPNQAILDNVPEILVSAVGLDVATESDDQGAVFVIDGDTGAILKRIRTPAGEASTDVGFGRSVLSPAGESACAGVGHGGISPCEYGQVPAVQQGDLNDGSRPDIVIGAPDYSEISATSPETPPMNPACSDGAGGGTCSRSGRVYIFYGEDLVNVAPTTYPVAASKTIKNPFAQQDDPALDQRFWGEEMGVSLAPVGDIGRCNLPQPPPPPGSPCPDELRSRTPDGQPEFTISVPRADSGTIPDAGLAFVIDGATGLSLDTYRHPEPQAESLFGFSNYNLPAIGDVGGFDTLPDVYMPAIGQSLQFVAQGRGYVFSGSNFGSHLISTLADPTPAKFGNFGTSAVGIGNVAGAEVGLDNARKEVLIGTFGPQEANLGVGNGINDVHIFSPLTDQVLQTISDPDQQPGSGFGRGLAPMGDVNGDGFLDFAAGAGGFDTTAPLLNNRGRIYLFTSDDSPLPPSPAPPRPPGSSSGSGSTVPALAGRTIEIESNRTRISLGAQITLRGVVEAFANTVRCERNQRVEIQRRRRGTIRYRNLPNRLLPNRVPMRTNSTGNFSLKIRPDATYYYRARLAQSTYCIGAVSPREQVIVRRKASGARR
jgi:hypothetical protein